MRNQLMEVRNLTKSFDKKTILNDLSFHVKRGEILGILGPNGAGKSTTFNIITGLLEADSGSISLENNLKKGSKAYKSNIGVVPQDISLYDGMTVYENLRFLGKLYGVRGKVLEGIISNLINDVHLREKRDIEICKLSGGMKRRVNIAAALVHDPKLIIMDEPTVGIDPQSRSLVWEIIKNLKESGKSIIITSHYVDEIERLSDRVLVIDNGKVIAEGTVNQLVNKYCESKKYLIEFYSENFEIIDKIKKIPGVKSVDVYDNKVNIITSMETNIIEDVIKLANKFGIDIKNIDFKKPSLEDVFFYFTGRGLRE